MQAALKRFADCGYAATSVRDIVSAAGVTQPVLYYYFSGKAGLYQALLEFAHDERYRLMQAAVDRAQAFQGKLIEILSALFAFLRSNRELLRLTFAAAFAAPGELPHEIEYMAKSRRNFEFIRRLMQAGLRQGVLDRRFGSRELAYGFYGQMNLYVMAHLALPGSPLNRRTAERIVELFMAGAGARTKAFNTSKL
jgi:AcrR family transcriptional regulator